MSFAALILAAGVSRRMGQTNKLLVELDGAPLVAHVLNAVQRSQIADICVVLGHQADAVRAVLRSFASPSVRFVTNPDYADGLATSLACGLRNLEEDHEGVAVCLGDMPFVASDVIDALCAALTPEAYAAVPVWGGEWGNPVVLSAEAVRDALLLAGDGGARALLRRHAGRVREVAARSDAVLRDIDRKADLGLS